MAAADKRFVLVPFLPSSSFLSFAARRRGGTRTSELFSQVPVLFRTAGYAVSCSAAYAASCAAGNLSLATWQLATWQGESVDFTRRLEFIFNQSIFFKFNAQLFPFIVFVSCTVACKCKCQE